MTNLHALLDLLKSEQRTLVVMAAQSGQLPPNSVLRRISDLENAIAATEALITEGPRLIYERRNSRPQPKPTE